MPKKKRIPKKHQHLAAVRFDGGRVSFRCSCGESGEMVTLDEFTAWHKNHKREDQADTG